MKLGLACASLLFASTAFAQAPGEYGTASGAPGMSEPVHVPPAPPPPKPHRWSIGLGVGSLGLAPHDAPDMTTDFGVGQLAVRYRATHHLEIELAFAGGREQLGDHEGDREVSQGVLALRYRFSPHRHWNWWLVAGMGSLAVTHVDASDDERESARQSTLQFGAGIEHRWERFALQLELRAVGVKANEAKAVPVVDSDVGMAVPPPMFPSRDGTLTPGEGMSGGQLVLAGNYYF